MNINDTHFMLNWADWELFHIGGFNQRQKTETKGTKLGFLLQILSFSLGKGK